MGFVFIFFTFLEFKSFPTAIVSLAFAVIYTRMYLCMYIQQNIYIFRYRFCVHANAQLRQAEQLKRLRFCLLNWNGMLTRMCAVLLHAPENVYIHGTYKDIKIQ